MRKSRYERPRMEDNYRRQRGLERVNNKRRRSYQVTWTHPARKQGEEDGSATVPIITTPPGGLSGTLTEWCLLPDLTCVAVVIFAACSSFQTHIYIRD